MMLYPLQLQVDNNVIFLNEIFCRLLNVYDGESITYLKQEDGSVRIDKASSDSKQTIIISHDCLALPRMLIMPLVLEYGQNKYIEAHYQNQGFLLKKGLKRCRSCFTSDGVLDLGKELLCPKCQQKLKSSPDLYKFISDAIIQDSERKSELESELFQLVQEKAEKFQKKDKICREIWHMMEQFLLCFHPDQAFLFRACVETLTAKTGEYLLIEQEKRT